MPNKIMLCYVMLIKSNLSIFAPNQEQLVISYHETMPCTGNRDCAIKPVTFSLMVFLNVVQRYFFKFTIHMDYAMDIMFMLLPGKP